MLSIPNYQIKNQIYESNKSVVYRGLRKTDKLPVILKVLKEDYPTPSEITHYKLEYEITHNLNLENIIKAYSLEKYQNTLVIILEDFGGESLKIFMEKQRQTETGKISLQQFLNIAIKIVEIIGEIHFSNIIHKDINPSNIVYNPNSEEIKLIDFGISTTFSRVNPAIKNPHILEGTLAYISPEQTGRMNRAIDYRTDFYSLGVTFYELLTNQLPFITEDTLELVHCHIAKQPLNPVKINPEIPKILADIIMKMLAKNAEDRYQSAWGIQTDLINCLMQLETNNCIEEFILGENDISDKFQIPEKLYGRNQEVEILLDAFTRIANNRSSIEMMLVTGYSGIGKSSLVQEIYKPITAHRGYFISGKFNQFQRNIPYSAIIQAFNELIRQLLTETKTQLNQWREKILTAVGPNGQVIIDVIPEVELIIDKQPKLPELGANEAQNRFNLVFANFIKVFCKKEHPLVIFLDDLQWVDAATLKLIKLMVTDTDTQYLFLIVSYRNNEVENAHPLMITLQELRHQRAIINQINLAPLKLEHISEIIADTLQTTHITQVKALAELVKHKTDGNPFFVNEFLKNLYTEKLINFDFERLTWIWDIEQIKAQAITDNVVDLTIAKLKKLPESTQNILRLAACVGSDFNLNLLSIICDKIPAEIFPQLKEAMTVGLIFPTSELDTELLIYNYKFTHDRIQQAAYSLIDEAQKTEIHLKIGRLLWQNTSPETLSEKIFEIVDRLNLGITLISDRHELNNLIKLNLIAGQKAKLATAYNAAFNYLNSALEILSEDSWETQYEIALNLYLELVEVACLSGQFTPAENLAAIVLEKSKNLLEKVKIYEVKIQTFLAQNQPLEAIQTALEILKLLEINFPPSPTNEDIQQELAKIKLNLTGKEPSELISLPLMQEPYKLAAMRILSNVFAAAYIATPQLFPLIVLKQIELSMQYGNSSWSAFAYAGYGVILCAVVGDINTGYKFGELADTLLTQLNAKELKSKTYEILNFGIRHWQEHIRETLPSLREGYQTGLETGDLVWAAICTTVYSYNCYYMGQELAMVEQEIANYSAAIWQIKQPTNFYQNQIFRQAALNLLSTSENPWILSGTAYDENQIFPIQKQAGDRTGIYYFFLNKLILAYLFGNLEIALENIDHTQQYLDAITGSFLVPLFYFYDSLIHLAIFSISPNTKQAEILLRVNSNQEKMQKWAEFAPMNYLHKFYLVEAEKYRCLNEIIKAMNYYDQAISKAKENEYLNEEALANELAAKFYLALGKEKFAQLYFTEAHYCYTRWGSIAKVTDLEKHYSQYINLTAISSNIMTTRKTITQITTKNNANQALDLAALMKAYQAISEEIVLDKLLASLMKTLIENAGAQSGCLLLYRSGQWSIAVAGSLPEENISILPTFSLDKCLPLSVMNYVKRTKQTIVKHNVANSTKFSNDPYIQAHQTKSILCAPLLYQGNLTGIIYLENNLSTGAFTDDRLEVIKLLSGQAAISLENAQLYNNLEQKVIERTKELKTALEDLQATQEELIQSEKMAALGQLVAGVAHEINTPLGAIRSSAGNITKFLKETLETLPLLIQALSEEETNKFTALLQKSLQKEINLSSKEKRQYKRFLIRQLEDLNINDPDIIADSLVDMGIYDKIEDFIILLQKPDNVKIIETAYKLSELQRGTTRINTATDRASKVVFALKTYSRYDSSGVMIFANIFEGIETVLTLYHNQLKQGVEVIRNYGKLPLVLCYPDELNQIWTNLIHNALQAMNNQGTLTIATIQEKDQAKISITDTGAGIPQDILPKIFQPFFTTKPAGEGSGLGLHIVQKIIDKHCGKISVESQPGHTTFHVFLPIQNP